MVEIDAVPIFGEIGAFGRWDRIMSPHETMSSPCLDLLCSFDLRLSSINPNSESRLKLCQRWFSETDL